MVRRASPDDRRSYRIEATRKAKTLTKRALEAARAEAPHTTLSAREHQVFTLLFQGRAVSDIAAELAAHRAAHPRLAGRGQLADLADRGAHLRRVAIDDRLQARGVRFADGCRGGAPRFLSRSRGVVSFHLRPPSRGPLGFPVIDIEVTLTDGSYHSVDSSDQAFRTAARIGVTEALPQCAPVLLEPILSVTISVPSDYTAKALQLVSGKRGQILGYEAKDGWRGWDEISAQIPQGEIHDLVVSLRSLTQGTGFFDWAYDHLQEVPDRLAQAIVGKHGAAAA